MGRHRYTPEENDFLREAIPGRSWREVSDAFASRFGLPLTKVQVQNRKAALGVRSGTVGGRFEAGHVPANKGRPWSEWMPYDSQGRCRETCFREGELNGTAARRVRGLLSVREGKDGYLQIKVMPRDAANTTGYWMSLARFEWMAANGRDWPDGHRCLFADRDNRNLSPDNLVPVPRELYPLVQGRHGLPYHDRETLEVAIAHARVVHARARLETRPRECGCCGATFTPEQPRQRRCRPCMDAAADGRKR